MRNMFGHIVKKLLKGERYNVKNFSEKSSVSEDKMRSVFSELEDQGVLIQVTENHFVLGDVDKEFAIEKIREASAELQKEVDDKTRVEISGALVENKEFETEKDPSEIL